DPSFAMGHQQLAESAAGLGDFETALRETGRALELGKELPLQDRQRILVWDAFLRGKLGEAERVAGELLRAHPDDIDTQRNIGWTREIWGHVHGIPFAEVVPPFAKVLEASFADPSLAVLDLVIAGELDQASAYADRLVQ